LGRLMRRVIPQSVPTFTLRRAARIVIALAVVVAIARFPFQFRHLSGALPVITRWGTPDEQYRQQLGEVPYDLLRTADRALPADATVLLATDGQDVRHREYTTYHRALYFLAPRSVWWVSPAPPDGTWEARWWISAPLTGESLCSIAEEKGASHLLLPGGSPLQAIPCALSGTPRELPGGDLIALGLAGNADPDRLSLSALPANPPYVGRFWPLYFLAAPGILFLMGYNILSLLRLDWHLTWIESVALAWALGAGFASLGMLWLNAAGVSLRGQVTLLTLLAVGATTWRIMRSRGTSNVQSPTPNAQRPTPNVQSSTFNVLRPSSFVLLLLLLEVARLALLAMGQPLSIWDSWVTWGMKARTIFLEGAITPAVYADLSRAVTHLDYPLLVPLLEAWLYQWVGAADDRLASAITVLYYLSLTGICYTAVRRWGGTRLFALGVLVAIALGTHTAALASFAFADVPLALYATTALLYLIMWLEKREGGALTIAAISAGLLPWTKREGLLLLVVLGLAVLVLQGLTTRREVRQRGWRALAGIAIGGIVLAGPWWAFVAWKGIVNTDFAAPTLTLLWANLDRLLVIAKIMLTYLLDSGWNFIWPLVGVFALFLWRSRSEGRRIAPRPGDLLLWTAAGYLALIALTYLFSVYQPYQQHVASSALRLIAHVAPLPVLWVAYRGLEV
ncbi:MAG: hypothetical protein ACRDIB_11145, partial [Ardenticatenaceae bacterium]